jgi:hypothetical protein
MLVARPLFWFVYRVEIWEGRVWLCEYCVWWDGSEDLLEMCGIQEDLNGYGKENDQTN